MSSGCGDVLSLEDLKTAKKHQTFEAEVITGKAGGVPGGANIDFATNPVTGQTQKTLPAVLRDAGFRPASFTFDTGGTLTTSDADLAVLWPGPAGDGQYYVWHGALPKVIPASSTPATAGGVSDTAWVPFGDITLRGDLLATTGAEQVFNGSTSVASQLNSLAADMALQKSRADWINPAQYGAVGDGVADDTAALNAATATGKDIRLSAGKTYLISSPIILPYMTTQQNFDGNNALIKSNASFITFRQRLADNSLSDVTNLKNFYNVNALGNAHAKSIYTQVQASQFLKISNGIAVNCRAVGFNNGLSVMGNARVVNLFADDIRNAALRGEGDNNFFMGLMAGWVAGDVVLIKSNYSYYGNLFCENAGVSPPDTEEPESLTDQGAMVSFAQDGQNAVGNTVDTCHCLNYGGAFAVFSGSLNKMTGDINGGAFVEERRAKGAGNAIYMSGTDNYIGDTRLDFVYSGIEMHTGSVRCHIGNISIARKSAFGTYIISVNGTTTSCSIASLSVKSGLSKSAEAYLGSAGTTIGTLTFENVSGPVSGSSPIRLLSDMRIENIYMSQNPSATSTAINVIVQGNASVGRLTIEGCLGTSLSVTSGATPTLDAVVINPRSTSTVGACEFLSASGGDSRVVGSMTIRGGGAIGTSKANGTLRIAAYAGPSWARADSGVTGSVIYPNHDTHTL